MGATDSQTAAKPNRGIWTWLGVAIVAGLALTLVTLLGRHRAPSGTEGPAIGRKLPYLRLEGLTGDAKPVSLDDLAGHVTLLNFWGTWCPPCRREFPHIVELAARLSHDDDFRLYAVSCEGDPREDLETVRGETEKFLNEQQVTLPTYADEKAASRRAMIASLGLDEFGYPTTLVLDRQGTIRGLWIGYEPGAERQMQSLIEKLLEKPTGNEAT
jgi:thiol-disulfide isomerase/thioredoxin